MPQSKEKAREYQQQRRANLKAQGLCMRCGKLPPSPGKTTCAGCGKNVRKCANRLYAERSQKNKCVRCGEPANKGISCANCSGIEKTSKQSSARKIYRARKAAGLCVTCGIKTTTRYYCAKHAATAARRAQLKRLRRKSVGVCVRCGQCPPTDGNCCEPCAQRRREAEKRVKLSVFGHYGVSCACCGESDIRMLTVDHINGGGNRHRRMLRGNGTIGGVAFYRWLKKQSYPEGYQVLCFNCNCGRAINGGVCPHQDRHRDEEMRCVSVQSTQTS